MCVIALAWNADPRWRLVVAANRDERHDRPADPLHVWDDAPIIAGRDRRAGGTWLAVSPSGGFAAVANLRGHGPAPTDLASRGGLVVALALRADEECAVSPDMMRYNPFNAFCASGSEATFLANRPAAREVRLSPGIHAIANAAHAVPCSRSADLGSIVGTALRATSSTDDLFAALRSERPLTRGQPPFLKDPVYGTRCSTLVLIDPTGEGQVLERRYDAGGRPTGDTRIHFNWPSNRASRR